MARQQAGWTRQHVSHVTCSPLPHFSTVCCRSYDKSVVASPSSSPITSQAQQNSDLVTPAFSPASSSGSGGNLQAQHAQQLSSSSLRSLAPKGVVTSHHFETLLNSSLSHPTHNSCFIFQRSLFPQAFLFRRLPVLRSVHPPPLQALDPHPHSPQAPVAALAHHARVLFKRRLRLYGPPPPPLPQGFRVWEIEAVDSRNYCYKQQRRAFMHFGFVSQLAASLHVLCALTHA